MVSAAPLLKNAVQFVRAAAADPVELWTKVQDSLAERREHGRPPCSYQGERDWERRLHSLLEAPWPCAAVSEFWALWPEVLQPLQARGLTIGRGAFGGWGDGEPGLARVIWCLVRHLRPARIVETGVARGVTSRVILEALQRNGAGDLWSIDLPPQLKPELHDQIAMAVKDRNDSRWTYIKGSSRRRLPGLLAELGQIDLFVHDSRHSEHNVRFELDQAWSALRPGGFLVADDIDLNWGFHSFTQAISGYDSLISYAEPLQPDPTRFEAKGLIGIARKQPYLPG